MNARMKDRLECDACDEKPLAAEGASATKYLQQLDLERARLLANAPPPALQLAVEDVVGPREHMLFAMQFGLDFRFPQALPVFDLSVLERWKWLWRRYRGHKHFVEEVKHIIDGDASVELIRLYIKALWERFYADIDTPLGPGGLLYGRDNVREYAEDSRTHEYSGEKDVSALLARTVQAVVAEIVNQTFGRLLRRLGLDAGEVLGDAVAAFIQALEVRGSIKMTSSYAQRWLFPVDRAREARQFITSKVAPANRVACAVASAPAPEAFAVGDYIESIEEELQPLFDLIGQLLSNPERVLRDALTQPGGPQLPPLPSAARITDAANAVVRSILELGSIKGVNCVPTRQASGNRVVYSGTCSRSIYFVPVAGPEREMPGHYWTSSHEVYPIDIINVMVLPESSEIFLRHLALFYALETNASHRTDLPEVLKNAVEALVRTLFQRMLDKIRERVVPQQLRDFLDWMGY